MNDKITLWIRTSITETYCYNLLQVLIHDIGWNFDCLAFSCDLAKFEGVLAHKHSTRVKQQSISEVTLRYPLHFDDIILIIVVAAKDIDEEILLIRIGTGLNLWYYPLNLRDYCLWFAT